MVEERSERLLLIGELADQAQVSHRTIRHYAEQGLIASAERPGGPFRRYEPRTVTVLALIRWRRGLHLSLDEIRRHLTSPSTEAAALVETKVDALRDEVALADKVIAELRDHLHTAAPPLKPDREAVSWLTNDRGAMPEMPLCTPSRRETSG